MQTEKDVKEPNSAPARGVLCAQGARRDASQSAWTPNLPLALVPTNTLFQNDVKIPVLESILKKLSVMS